MIPRRFFGLFDLSVFIVAFLAAYILAPSLFTLFAPGGPLRTPWMVALFSPATWQNNMPSLFDFLWVLIVMAPPAMLVLSTVGGHRPLIQQSRTRIALSSIVAPLAGLGMITMILFALKRPYWSRLFIFSFTFLSGASLCIYRLILLQYFLRRQATGYYAQNVLLIGQPAGLEWMARYFSEQVPSALYRPIGYLCACSDMSAASPINEKKGSILSLEHMGYIDELGDCLINRPIHEVIAVHPASGGDWIEQAIRDCDQMGVLLRIVPETLLLGERHRLHTLYPFEPLNLPAVVLAPPHWSSGELFIKRILDIVISAIMITILSPLMGLIALLIKITTPHLPVLYPWHVVGQNGVEFTGYKFTTMVADADERKTVLLPKNEMTGPVFKIKEDPRVTPLGRFLRKYSLNELPQLFSVLEGDMSLVGPRPAFRHELERYEFWHKRKLSIRPGITCLWQVRGRNQISDFDEWVKMDLEYIDNWSLWLDLRILARTAWVVIAGTGS